MHNNSSQRCLISFDNDSYSGLRQIISGGQDGADLAGLVAASGAGLETGGHAPRFYRTSSGSNYELRDLFNLKETTSTGYQRRTELNVQNSDATIRFASDFGSAGEVLTLKFIKKYNKPFYDVSLPQQNSFDKTVNNIANWIIKNEISILNVAGNRDKYTRYGPVFLETFTILFNVFQNIRNHNGN